MIETFTEVAVSPEDDAEIRRIAITNHSRSDSRDRADQLRRSRAGAACRRSGASGVQQPVHRVVRRSRARRDHLRAPPARATKGGCTWVTCWRGGRDWATPSNSKPTASTSSAAAAACASPPRSRGTEPLSGATGAVLDPIVSLRARLRVPPGVTARVSFTTVVAENEDGVRALIEKYHDPQVCARAFALASTHSEIELRHLGVSREDGSRFQRLGRPCDLCGPALAVARSDAPATRAHLRICGSTASRATCRSCWSRLPTRHISPRAGARAGAGIPARARLQVRSGRAQRNSDELSPGRAGRPAAYGGREPVACMARSARRAVPAARGSDGRRRSRAAARRRARDFRRRAGGGLDVQMRRPLLPSVPPPKIKMKPAVPEQSGAATGNRAAGVLSTDSAGSPSDGREFHVSARPPAPWSNVIANERFGFVATDSGLGATWSENSYHNRLTPWSNDPIVDPPSEVVYLRDDKSGEFWTRHTGARCRGGKARHEVRAGIRHLHASASRPRRRAHRVRARARSHQDSAAANPQRRRLRPATSAPSTTWTGALSDTRSRSAAHIVTSIDTVCGALFARNAFRASFGGRVAFIDAVTQSRSMTGDRSSFIGRNGTLSDPLAMEFVHLPGRVGRRARSLWRGAGHGQASRRANRSR